MKSILLISNVADVDPDVYKTVVTLFVLFLIMIFISSLLRIMLNHKLKSKIISKGALSEEMMSLLQSNSKEIANNNVKWFLILLSIGIGLFVVHYFPPIGLHSLAIMVLSISAAFLLFFIYLRQEEK